MTTNDDAASVQRAVDVLLKHRVGDGGLLDELRPYAGRVNAEALADVLSATQTLISAAERGAAIPVAALSHLFGVDHLVRRWALDKDSMLVQNRLISDVDWQTLMDFVIDLEMRYST